MRFGIVLFAATAAVITVSWWWLGAPIAMPPSPLDPGEKLYCVSYAPFRGLETPLDQSTRIDAARIDDDLTRLSELTDCVRVYSTQLGLDQIAEIAGRHGLKVMQGLWLGTDLANNQREIDTAVALAKRHPDTIRSLVVGNEVLLRGEMAATTLAETIRTVKAQVPVPVTYADVWEFWLRNPEVFDAVDFVTIHILPYWEDLPVPASEAAAHVDAIRRRMVGAFPNKEVLIGEVGWPSAGRMRNGALPSPANQARVVHDVLTLAKREGFRVNLIEAFDQPWKEYLEGTVGGHWGFLDGTTRRFKFAWGAAVSNHPHWRWQAVGGAVLALVIFASAGIAGWRALPADRAPAGRWIGVGAMAATSGALAGWAVENVPLESLGLGGWLGSTAMVALALAAPVVCAAAVMTGTAIPDFSCVLAGRREPAVHWIARGLGVVAVLLTVISLATALGLVFDPRYRDFPFTPLTAAAVPLAIVAATQRRARGLPGTAELLAAVTLGGSVVYIAFHEGFANWQALWLCGTLTVIAITLVRLRDARS